MLLDFRCDITFAPMLVGTLAVTLSLLRSTLLGRETPRLLPGPAMPVAISLSLNWLCRAQSCCHRRTFSTVSRGKFSQYSIPVFLLRTGGEDLEPRRSGESRLSSLAEAKWAVAVES